MSTTTLKEMADPVARPALVDEDAELAKRNADTAYGLHGNSGCADVDDGNGAAVCSCVADYDAPCPIHSMRRPGRAR